jgi:hypothetical protein
MVMDAGKQDPAIRAIREWFASLSPGIARLTEQDLEYEHVMTLTPTNPKASPIEFRISRYGTFGLYFGKGFAFEEIPSSVELVLDVCESIRQGRVKEEIWEWRGRIVKTKGVLELTANNLTDQGSSHWAALLGLGTRRQIQYEPWD